MKMEEDFVYDSPVQKSGKHFGDTGDAIPMENLKKGKNAKSNEIQAEISEFELGVIEIENQLAHPKPKEPFTIDPRALILLRKNCSAQTSYSW
jgi:hypothetical protein